MQGRILHQCLNFAYARLDYRMHASVPSVPPPCSPAHFLELLAIVLLFEERILWAPLIFSLFFLFFPFWGGGCGVVMFLEREEQRSPFLG